MSRDIALLKVAGIKCRGKGKNCKKRYLMSRKSREKIRDIQNPRLLVPATFSTIKVSQSYFRLPRQTIRENSNIFFIFPQDSKNHVHIYRDLCAIDRICYSIFQKFCTDVWRTKYNFVTVDLTKPCNLGKYRKNLNEYWSPKYDGLAKYLADKECTLNNDDVLSHDDVS